jgi:ATP-dependent DNA ligase
MLAVSPPIAPMLARLARELPTGPDLVYEPKWDGFRCLAFCDADAIDLRSRNDRPLSRYFPEVVQALRSLRATAVLDGELLAYESGRVDFAALMARLHPSSSRVEQLSRQSPACFVAFDVLAVAEADLRTQPFAERRAVLEALLGTVDTGVMLSPISDDSRRANDWLHAGGPEIDGVIAKRRAQPYEPGRRSMIKVKLERTADCVVAGFRLFAATPSVGSLLLGCYDGDELRHVGVAGSFTAARRVELLHELAPLAEPLVRHPWRHGFALEGGPMGRLRGAAGRWTPDMPLDWVPLRIERVVEVAYTQLDGIRFRHPAQFRRWRPDREPRSCNIDQLIERSHPTP